MPMRNDDGESYANRKLNASIERTRTPRRRRILLDQVDEALTPDIETEIAAIQGSELPRAERILRLAALRGLLCGSSIVFEFSATLLRKPLDAQAQADHPGRSETPR